MPMVPSLCREASPSIAPRKQRLEGLSTCRTAVADIAPSRRSMLQAALSASNMHPFGDGGIGDPDIITGLSRLL